MPRIIPATTISHQIYTPVDPSDLIAAVRGLLLGHESPPDMTDRASLLEDSLGMVGTLLRAADIVGTKRLRQNDAEALRALAIRLAENAGYALLEIDAIEAEQAARWAEGIEVDASEAAQ